MECKEDLVIEINNIENECPICLEQYTNNELFYLECNHKYHKNCIYDWINKNINSDITCPLCRGVHDKIIKYNNKYYIYDKYENVIIIEIVNTTISNIYRYIIRYIYEYILFYMFIFLGMTLIFSVVTIPLLKYFQVIT